MIALWVISDVKAEGWASLALLTSFFSGAIISVLGMVGLYVGRTFESVKSRPKYIIQEKINSESKSKPLNDQALVDFLNQQGYQIARRTVAKYREQMNIPVARLRKKL